MGTCICVPLGTEYTTHGPGPLDVGVSFLFHISKGKKSRERSSTAGIYGSRSMRSPVCTQISWPDKLQQHNDGFVSTQLTILRPHRFSVSLLFFSVLLLSLSSSSSFSEWPNLLSHAHKPPRKSWLARVFGLDLSKRWSPDKANHRKFRWVVMDLTARGRVLFVPLTFSHIHTQYIRAKKWEQGTRTVCAPSYSVLVPTQIPEAPKPKVPA